jgi:competence ComEA-like helix-hairpin-helix protein
MESSEENMPLFLTSHEKKAMLFVGLLSLSGAGVLAWRHLAGAPNAPVRESVQRRMADRARKYEARPVRPAVDLNRASEQDLLRIPSVGRVTAARIVQYRRLNGPFRDAAELDRVPGIGPKRLEEIRPYVFVEREPTPVPRAQVRTSP